MAVSTSNAASPSLHLASRVHVRVLTFMYVCMTVQNIKLVQSMDLIAEAKRVQPGQLALAWVHSHIHAHLMLTHAHAVLLFSQLGNGMSKSPTGCCTSTGVTAAAMSCLWIAFGCDFAVTLLCFQLLLHC